MAMNVILNMVISPNGFIAREDGNEDWLPSEGWDDFVQEARRYKNIVMGRETYSQVTRHNEDYFNIADLPHKIIVTNNKSFKTPAGYTVVHSPEEAVDYLKKASIKDLFLIGGGVLNAEFVKRKLVTRIELVVTPYIIGSGRPVLAFGDFETGLTLVDVKRLSLGRVLLTYKVHE